jgi:hypothetical protein
MLGYDQRDRSNVNSPGVLDALAGYLGEHGVEDVAVLEAPTVYGRAFANRSVEEVARYFGLTSPRYRIVDISEALRPYTRGGPYADLDRLLGEAPGDGRDDIERYASERGPARKRGWASPRLSPRCRPSRTWRCGRWWRSPAPVGPPIATLG